MDTPEEVGKIYGTANGFILCFRDAEGNASSLVYEYEEEVDKPEAIKRLLCDIMEWCCGWYNSKHKPRRINIEVKKNR